MDKPTLYIETSIVSYLAADRSRHPVTARNQQLTHDWWNTRREDYALYTSSLTWAESAKGDPVMAQRRLALLSSFELLAAPSRTGEIAEMLWRGIPLPVQAEADAQHITLAAVNGMAHLLTWDRKHSTNPRLRSRIEAILRSRGCPPPIFCTPDELMR
jgi:hypothetical protein